ncbi:MAG: hypothetical protein PHH30_03820, partial [Bacteroidales bacterium]|nr:hypothetical protein [Bacteroidales bacterium]
MTFCTTTYNDNEIIGYPNELLIAKDNLPLDTDTTSHEYCCLVTRATRAGGSDKGILKHQNTYDQYDFCNEYRFGFQGQEKDDEWTGQTGSHLNFKYRMYDARIGRFFAIDPLAAKYPYNSTYAFSENRVIDCVELEGLERMYYSLKIAGG